MVKKIWSDNIRQHNYQLYFDDYGDGSLKPTSIVLEKYPEDKPTAPAVWRFEIADKDYIDTQDTNLQNQINSILDEIAPDTAKLVQSSNPLTFEFPAEGTYDVEATINFSDGSGSKTITVGGYGMRVGNKSTFSLTQNALLNTGTVVGISNAIVSYDGTTCNIFMLADRLVSQEIVLPLTLSNITTIKNDYIDRDIATDHAKPVYINIPLGTVPTDNGVYTLTTDVTFTGSSTATTVIECTGEVNLYNSTSTSVSLSQATDSTIISLINGAIADGEVKLTFLLNRNYRNTDYINVSATTPIFTKSALDEIINDKIANAEYPYEVLTNDADGIMSSTSGHAVSSFVNLYNRATRHGFLTINMTSAGSDWTYATDAEIVNGSVLEGYYNYFDAKATFYTSGGGTITYPLTLRQTTTGTPVPNWFAITTLCPIDQEVSSQMIINLQYIWTTVAR